MNKRLILWIKIVIMVSVVAVVGWKFYSAWRDVQDKKQPIAWGFVGIAVLAFAGSMLTSALVWRWLAWKMRDRSPTVPLLAAYTFSQLGKYIFGKVALLLMRIDRSGRFGMMPSVCTLSTILENALYMISGGLVGLVAIVRLSQALTPRQQLIAWIACGVVVPVLAAACVPAVFYGLVNRLLRKMKRPEVPASRRLKMPILALAVVGFIPCWIFGGVALWASVRCVSPLLLTDSWWFAGAYALSVIIGMASLIPGGLFIREAVLGTAVTIQLSPLVGEQKAILMATVVAALQRLAQLIAEIVLGVAGGAITGISRAKSSRADESADRTAKT